MPEPAIPSPAATLVLLRDRPAGGLEILLIQRHSKSKFAAGDFVFAGGKVDYIPADIFGRYPKLMAVHDAVRDHPRVRAWYARS